MANTQYLTQIVEPFVVQWVSNRLGIPLKPLRLEVSPRTDGSMVHFCFDGVSDDQMTALLVSTSYTVKPGGTRKLHVDASILLNTPLSRRLMAFISKDVATNFMNQCDGLLPLRKIEILVCNSLPSEMQARIAEIQTAARNEVGDKGKIWKPGGRRK